MSDDPRREPTTTEFAAVPEWAIDLTRSVKEGFAKVDANVGLVISDLEVVKGRVGNLEDARRNDEARDRANSTRAKEPSSHDLKTASELADEITARKKLEADVALTKADVAAIKTDTAAQTVILTDLRDGASRIFANPIVRSIATMAGTAILLWLTGIVHPTMPLPPQPTPHVTAPGVLPQ